MAGQHELILILDFGSQYTQLIARRIREQNVYCEIVPFNTDLTPYQDKNIKTYLIDCLYHLAGLLIAGIILGLWVV